MGVLTFSVGSETSDWREDLQDLFENGTLSPTGSTGTTLTLTSGDLELEITGLLLSASDGRTADTGTVTSFTLTDDGTTVLTMSGLLLANAGDLQDMLDGADGLDPFSADFLDLIAPFFTDEAVSATGSDEGEAIFGSSGIDTIDGGEGDDYISANAGNDIIDGGDDADTVSYLYDDDPTYGMLVNLSGVQQNGDAGLGSQPIAAHTAADPFSSDVDSLSNIENVEGTNYTDAIFGDDEANVLSGNAGYDKLYGLGGNDTLRGGSESDTLDGGDGVDTADYSHDEDNGATHGVFVNLTGANVGADFVSGWTVVDDHSAVDGFGDVDTLVDIESVTGTDFKDVIFGDDADNTIWGLDGDDLIAPGTGDNHVDGGDGDDTVLLERNREDYQVTVKPDGTIVLIEIGGDDHGDRSFYDNVESFQFADTTVATDDLTSDIVHPGYYGPTFDQGGWELGWYTSGTMQMGWHYESGVDHGWFFNPWGWTNGAWGWETGWFIHEGWEYGWYESGAWAWGWHYDWGGWGNGLTIGLTFGWWIGDVYGPPQPAWYSGPSADYGGWTLGWHGEGQSLYGWHTESGWDLGWYSSAEGYVAGWYYHIGWELGWYTAGWSVYGWFYDWGGWGTGWDIGVTPSGWFGTQSGGWWSTAPAWVAGWSSDAGGWEYGWYAVGGWALGWHAESGWDLGWYETSSGWSWGWFYHAGVEYGWYGTGTLAWGWHFDFGGLGSGWNLGWGWGGIWGSEFEPH